MIVLGRKFVKKLHCTEEAQEGPAALAGRAVCWSHQEWLFYIFPSEHLTQQKKMCRCPRFLMLPRFSIVQAGKKHHTGWQFRIEKAPQQLLKALGSLGKRSINYI